jgi:hypothetical protein
VRRFVRPVSGEVELDAKFPGLLNAVIGGMEASV